ncbi:MAG: hypothetical protein J5588_04825 [Bacteroidales bacterium]|nr:hypothetical protein [Bacteroidales bacterium]MBR4498143.1 hypothetical protein [Bacteroidales bacterium]
MIKNDATSVFLRDCMAGAVMKLLEQWPLDKIQVKQICDASGYHRASWFRAFHSKSEAVTYHMVRLWQLYCEQHGLDGYNDWVINNAEAWFQYNYEIRDTLRLLQHRGLMKELADSFTATLHDHYIADPIRAYHTAIFAFSLYGILCEWIIRDFDRSPKVMASILRDALASML